MEHFKSGEFQLARKWIGPKKNNDFSLKLM